MSFRLSSTSGLEVAPELIELFRQLGMLLLELFDLGLDGLLRRSLLHLLGGAEVAGSLGPLGRFLHGGDLVFLAGRDLDPLAADLLQVGLVRAGRGELLVHRLLLERDLVLQGDDILGHRGDFALQRRNLFLQGRKLLRPHSCSTGPRWKP